MRIIHNLKSKKYKKKFNFCKINKIRSDQIVSSLKTHETKSRKTFQMFKKNL